jgi:hypothetical protein
MLLSELNVVGYIRHSHKYLWSDAPTKMDVPTTMWEALGDVPDDGVDLRNWSYRKQHDCECVPWATDGSYAEAEGKLIVIAAVDAAKKET